MTNISQGPIVNDRKNRTRYWLSNKLLSPTSNTITFDALVQASDSDIADAMITIPTNTTVKNNYLSRKLLPGHTVKLAGICLLFSSFFF